MTIRFSAVATLAVFMAYQPRTEACSCASPAVEVWPNMAHLAPRNTHVWIWLPPWMPNEHGEVESTSAVPQWVLREEATVASIAKTKNTTGKRKNSGKKAARKTVRGSPLVPVDQREFTSGQVRMIELIPRELLKAATRYQVVVRRPDRKDTMVGEFVTGDAEDTDVPLWEGIEASRYVHAPAACCDCSTGEPHLILQLKSSVVKEASEKATPVLYAIWGAVGDDAAGPVDYTLSPTVVVKNWGSRVLLGHPSQCSPPNFAFPKTDGLRIGVRIMDLAGNFGAPSEVIVDLQRPVRDPDAAYP